MICGAEDLMSVCKEKIAAHPHALSADGRFSWEEVECLGACANAPMAQIGKDYYEDLTTERLAEILDALGRGEVPRPGPQNGRFASEPLGGETTLKSDGARTDANASVALALEIGDTVRRIDGTEVPLRAPWRRADGDVPVERDLGLQPAGLPDPEPTPGPRPSKGEPVDDTGATELEAKEKGHGHPREGEPGEAANGETSDDLTRISGIGPKIRDQLYAEGIRRFDQIAAWTEEDIDRFDTLVGGPDDRVRRDEGVAQARRLAGEGET
jgi:NADH-quinone oxidoreductase subunit E